MSMPQNSTADHHKDFWAVSGHKYENTLKVQLSGVVVSFAWIPSALSRDNSDLYTTGENGSTTPRSWISPENK